MGEIIKKPQQERSLRTRENIMKAGSKLFKERGYHNVTTPEIAKEAGVSTGILYRYFKNKMAIVVEIMKQIVDQRIQPMLDGLVINIRDQDNFPLFLEQVMHELCLLHEELGSLHNDLGNLLQQEGAVSDYISVLEMKLINQAGEMLIGDNFQMDHMTEKIHIVYNLLEDYCHEKVFYNHKDMDYEVLKKETIQLIIHLIHPEQSGK